MDDTHIWLWKCLKSKRGKNLLESMCNVEYLPSDKDRQLNCDCFGMIFLIVSMFLRHLYCLKRLQGQTHCLDKRPHLLYLFSVVTPLCCTTTLHYYWTTPEATSVFTHSITWDVTKGTCPDWQDILPFFTISSYICQVRETSSSCYVCFFVIVQFWRTKAFATWLLNPFWFTLQKSMQS
jgi:hypothetical protein